VRLADLVGREAKVIDQLMKIDFAKAIWAKAGDDLRLKGRVQLSISLRARCAEP
jgi:hypothetical protein